jgi:phage gpG-like protein
VPQFVRIRIFGHDRVQRRLFGMATVAGDMRPALSKIADQVMDAIKGNIESQGERTGSTWPQLEPSTIKRKVARGQDPRALIASHALINSMSLRGDPNQRLQINPQSMSLQSALPYAARQQYGGHGIPARPYVVFTREEKRAWADICRDELIGAFRRG